MYGLYTGSGTYECDADPHFKEVILNAGKDDIKLIHSPVGYPARGVITQLQRDMAAGTAPAIKCISNCVTPCNHGEEAREVGFCISDRLADAQRGITETGLFFSGANGYRLQVGDVDLNWGQNGAQGFNPTTAPLTITPISPSCPPRSSPSA